MMLAELSQEHDFELMNKANAIVDKFFEEHPPGVTKQRKEISLEKWVPSRSQIKGLMNVITIKDFEKLKAFCDNNTGKAKRRLEDDGFKVKKYSNEPGCAAEYVLLDLTSKRNAEEEKSSKCTLEFWQMVLELSSLDGKNLNWTLMKWIHDNFQETASSGNSASGQELDKKKVKEQKARGKEILMLAIPRFFQHFSCHYYYKLKLA